MSISELHLKKRVACWAEKRPRISASTIARHFNISYTAASRIFELLKEENLAESILDTETGRKYNKSLRFWEVFNEVPPELVDKAAQLYSDIWIKQIVGRQFYLYNYYGLRPDFRDDLEVDSYTEILTFLRRLRAKKVRCYITGNPVIEEYDAIKRMTSRYLVKVTKARCIQELKRNTVPLSRFDTEDGFNLVLDRYDGTIESIDL